MATIGSLVADLSLESSKFRRDLGRARRDLNSFGARVNRTLGGIDRGFAQAARGAKAFVGAFAVTAGISGIDQMLQSVSDLADTADKLGLTTDRLQELRFAAEQNGISANTLDTAIQRFTRRVGEAAQGTGELRSTLDQYGISVRNADGSTRSIAAVLGDLGDRISAAEGDSERLRIAFKAFDSEGAALVNLLRDGRAGLEQWTRAARDAGVVMDDDLVRRTREANREWQAFSASVSTQAKTRLLEGIVALRELAEMMGIVSESGGMSEIAQAEADLSRLRQQADETRAAIDRILQGRDLTDHRIPPVERFQAGAMTGDLRETIIQIGALESRLRRLRRQREELNRLPPPSLTPAIEDTAVSDRVRQVTEDLRFQAEQLGRAAEVQRVYNEARRAGVAVDSAAGLEIRNLVERIQEAERAQAAVIAKQEAARARLEAQREAAAAAARENELAMGRIQSSAEQAMGSLARDLLRGENAMESLQSAARRTVDMVLDEFIRLAVIKPLLGSIFGGVSGGAAGAGGGLLGSIGGLLGLQHGGSFTVGGQGGTDSQLVRFMATPGERVTVETPAQQSKRSGGGAGVTIHQTVNAPPDRLRDAKFLAAFANQVSDATVQKVAELLKDGRL